MSNPKNAHENASAFANNAANQVAGDRDRFGSWSLSRVVYNQRRCRGIRAAIAPVSCERYRRRGKGYVLAVVFTKRQPLIRSDRPTLLPVSVHNHSEACLCAMDSESLIVRAPIRMLYAAPHVTQAPTPQPPLRTVQQESPKTPRAI